MSKDNKEIQIVRSYLRNAGFNQRTLEEQKDFLTHVVILRAASGDNKVTKFMARKLGKVFNKLKYTEQQRQDTFTIVLERIRQAFKPETAE